MPDKRTAESAAFGGDFREIRWIAFDAVNTLIYPDPPAPAAYAQVARKYGSRLEAGDVAERFRTAFGRREDADRRRVQFAAAEDPLRTSEARERRRWEAIVAAVLDDVADRAGCFAELFDYFARPAAWACFADVGPTLIALKDRGYRLAVASNFDDRLNRVCDGLAELRPIEARVISSLVGYRKPSPAFYRELAATAGCPPCQVLMVGDDYENDVLGARHAGLPAVHLKRTAPTSGPGIANLPQLLERLEGGRMKDGG